MAGNKDQINSNAGNIVIAWTLAIVSINKVEWEKRGGGGGGEEGLHHGQQKINPP